MLERFISRIDNQNQLTSVASQQDERVGTAMLDTSEKKSF